jgi:hypothetical protein
MLEESNCECKEALYGKKPISWKAKTAALEKASVSICQSAVLEAKRQKTCRVQ